MTETEIAETRALLQKGFTFQSSFYELIDGKLILRSLYSKPGEAMHYKQAENYALEHDAKLPTVKELLIFLNNKNWKFEEKIVWTSELNETGAHCVFSSLDCSLRPRLASDEVDVFIVKII